MFIISDNNETKQCNDACNELVLKIMMIIITVCLIIMIELISIFACSYIGNFYYHFIRESKPTACHQHNCQE